MKTKIWWCEYRSSMDTLSVCRGRAGGAVKGCLAPAPASAHARPEALTKMTMMTKAARYDVRAIHMLTKR